MRGPVQREGARGSGQGAVVARGAGPAAPDVEAVAGLRRGGDGDARAGVVRARAGDRPPAVGLDAQVDGVLAHEVRRHGAVGGHGHGAGSRARAGAGPAVETVAPVGRGRDGDVRPGTVRAAAGDAAAARWRGAGGEDVGAREMRRHGARGAHGHGTGAGARAGPRPAVEAVAAVRRGRDRGVAPGIVRTAAAHAPPAGRGGARGQGVARDEVRRDGARGVHAHGAGARARAGPRPAAEAVAAVRRGRDRDVAPGVVRAPAADRPPAGRGRRSWSGRSAR